MKQMPSKGGHLAMVIVGFLCGILWGILAIGPYNKMKAAIDAGDDAAAWTYSKNVKLYYWIGIAVNILIIIGRMAGG